jgi:NAD(P)-dependent dehydrogenase (short-subunit alcohol dehydrogenase family)
MTPATAPSLLVTGGGRGIGRAVALRFAREGWGVAVMARSKSELAETAALVAKAGGKALAIEGDVSKEADGETAVKRTEETFGGIDVLVNNAGLFKVKAAHETSTELWRQILETNLSGPFFVTRAVIRGMLARKRGRAIVNVSSEAGKKGFAGSGAYCASKYGLCGFGDAIREELRPAGIRVINVLPGQVDTKAWDGCGLDLDRIGLRRDKMMKPEQVADAIAHAVLADGAVAEEILLKPI